MLYYTLVAVSYTHLLIESPERRRGIAEEYAKLNLRRGASAKIAEKIGEFFRA